jgi:large subunit ribosomal protein L15
MAIGLDNLRAPKGATHKKKRVGRGPGTGLGKTAGRGEKGQKSRSGYSSKIGFEGGQMPLHRRLPKRGFTNIFKKEWIEVSLASLEQNFEADSEVTPEVLHERGLIKKAQRDVVVLGTGEISKALKVSAHRFTKSAREKIERAGGAATLIERRPEHQQPEQ